MSNIFNIIPKLTHTPTPNNPHNLPSYASLWEILLNQHFSREYIMQVEEEMGESEDAYISLLTSLYNNNQLYICDPLTGEILFHHTPGGEEYMAADFQIIPEEEAGV